MARKKIEWCDELTDPARKAPRSYACVSVEQAIAELTGELPPFQYADAPPMHHNCRCEIIAKKQSGWKFRLFWIAVLVGAQLIAVWLS